MNHIPSSTFGIITQSRFESLTTESSDKLKVNIGNIFDECSFDKDTQESNEQKLVAKAYKVSVGEQVYYLVEQLSSNNNISSDDTKRKIAKFIGTLQKRINIDETVDIKSANGKLETEHRLIIGSENGEIEKFSQKLSKSSYMHEILSDFLPGFLRSIITSIRHRVFLQWNKGLELKNVMNEIELIESKVSELKNKPPLNPEEENDLNSLKQNLEGIRSRGSKGRPL